MRIDCPLTFEKKLKFEVHFTTSLPHKTIVIYF